MRPSSRTATWSAPGSISTTQRPCEGARAAPSWYRAAAQPNLDLATLDGLGDKTVIFGVISMGDSAPETPQTVAARIRAALAHLPPERLLPRPDCGMKYIPREIPFAKLKALAERAAMVRRELRGS